MGGDAKCEGELRRVQQNALPFRARKWQANHPAIKTIGKGSMLAELVLQPRPLRFTIMSLQEEYDDIGEADNCLAAILRAADGREAAKQGARRNTRRIGR